MAKPTWRVTSTRAAPAKPTKREPSIVELQLAVGDPWLRTLRLVVHRHIDAYLDQWHVSCHDLGVQQQPICARGASLEDAQKTALAQVLDFVRGIAKALEKPRRPR